MEGDVKEEEERISADEASHERDASAPRGTMTSFTDSSELVSGTASIQNFRSLFVYNHIYFLLDAYQFTKGVELNVSVMSN